MEQIAACGGALSNRKVLASLDNRAVGSAVSGDLGLDDRAGQGKTQGPSKTKQRSETHREPCDDIRESVSRMPQKSFKISVRSRLIQVRSGIGRRRDSLTSVAIVSHLRRKWGCPSAGSTLGQRCGRVNRH